MAMCPSCPGSITWLEEGGANLADGDAILKLLRCLFFLLNVLPRHGAYAAAHLVIELGARCICIHVRVVCVCVIFALIFVALPLLGAIFLQHA